jgi:hypothetical protein
MTQLGIQLGYTATPVPNEFVQISGGGRGGGK